MTKNNEKFMNAEEAWASSVNSVKTIIDIIGKEIDKATKESKLSITFYWDKFPGCEELSNYNKRDVVIEYLEQKGYTVYADTYLSKNTLDISWKHKKI